MLLTETGAIPVLSDNTTNLAKAIGKVLDGYEVICANNINYFKVDIIPIDKLTSSNRQTVGELRIKPLIKTKFIGYGPKFSQFSDWINTGYIIFLLIFKNLFY